MIESPVYRLFDLSAVYHGLTFPQHDGTAVLNLKAHPVCYTSNRFRENQYVSRVFSALPPVVIEHLR